uniref:Uncharacterized protein n=1 Tax=Cyanoderma ruficeps TaxID=181631 RepID=A0A8C3RDG4_9PASS
ISHLFSSYTIFCHAYLIPYQPTRSSNGRESRPLLYVLLFSSCVMGVNAQIYWAHVYDPPVFRPLTWCDLEIPISNNNSKILGGTWMENPEQHQIHSLNISVSEWGPQSHSICNNARHDVNSSCSGSISWKKDYLGLSHRSVMPVVNPSLDAVVHHNDTKTPTSEG